MNKDENFVEVSRIRFEFNSYNDYASNEALNNLLAELLVVGLIEFALPWTTNCVHRIFVVSEEEMGKRAKGEGMEG